MHAEKLAVIRGNIHTHVDKTDNTFLANIVFYVFNVPYIIFFFMSTIPNVIGISYYFSDLFFCSAVVICDM